MNLELQDTKIESSSKIFVNNMTLLVCMFCFPNSDYMMFSRREFVVCLFISHACGCMAQNLKERIL